jgi:aspartyl/glutamyl-tRNA(Asn/Gln) amidotransferase C subunit
MKTSSVAAVVLLSIALPGTFAFLLPLPQHSASSPSASRLAAASSSSPQHPEVTPELIKHTATLAQLQFEEAEIASLVPRFQAFLTFVDKMQDVPDTAAGLAPGTMPTVDKVLRPDQPSVFPNQDAIFANMAEQEDAYLSVPKVGEEDT